MHNGGLRPTNLSAKKISRSSFTANQGLVCPARESPPSCPGRAPSLRRYRVPFLQSILTERKKRERKKVKN